MAATLSAQIRWASTTRDLTLIRAEVQRHLDAEFSDLASLAAQAGPSTGSPITPSSPRFGGSPHLVGSHRDGQTSRESRDGRDGRGKRKRRTLKEEIAFWQAEEEAASLELQATSSILPQLLEKSQTKLQKLLSDAQELSHERYALADKLAGLVSDLARSDGPENAAEEAEGAGATLLERMEQLQAELDRLEVGLAMASVLERVMLLSESTLSPQSRRPSPLAALPHYCALHELVGSMDRALPRGMTLLHLVTDVRDRTWRALKDAMCKDLLSASEALKWPLRVDYAAVPPQQRRTFEHAFQDLLYLQTEGEALHGPPARPPPWYAGEGLYPLQALIQPIALRFRYHFQGSRNTNRVDKPEWAFSNILDVIYEQTGFIEDYLQPLAARAGYGDIHLKFILLLFPILLSLLRSRIPRLLDHPALLAHTVYQTVVFDDAIRSGDFDLSRTSLYAGTDAGEWEGLAGVILEEEGWFEQWLAGEKKFVDAQLHEIISNAGAWTISDEPPTDEDSFADGLRPTTSARQVKSLIEQVTDRYAPLPSLGYKLPFLTSIQLPTIQAYLSRISGSLDAFETLSSAFVRVVPGALSGNTRSGAHVDQTRLTGGVAGLERLMKARLSAGWILAALKSWSDDVFFVEISSDLGQSTHLRWKMQNDPLLPESFKNGSQGDEASVFDVLVDRYSALCERADDMVVRLVTVEVENDLKQHLQRRWDQTPETTPAPDLSLVNALTTFSALLRGLSTTLPALSTSRLYRRIVSHLSNHMQQRAVYSGWSRFTFTGGTSFASEIADWVQTSLSILEVAETPANTGIEVPWQRLVETGKILRLPAEDKEGGPTFAQAMAAAWSDGDEGLTGFMDRAEVKGMGREDLQGVLRRRVECWR